MAQQKPAYVLYGPNGKGLKYKKLLKKAAEADVICFGESHNNPIAHWLEYELLKDVIAMRGADQLIVGAEMFETHQQPSIDRYLKGELEEKAFEEEAKMWNNYKTDYKPVVELCKENNIAVIATNVPRKYARMVARGGGLVALDTITDAERALLAPLPFDIDYELPSYAAMKEMMGGHGSGMDVNAFVAAQAIKDATMAYFILKNYSSGKLFYHMNGSYHSDSKEGIIWYLKQAQPELNVFNLSVIEQEDVSSLEEEGKGKADAIIVIPASMTKTY